MAHGQWTEVEARGVLEALGRSGLGVEKFARQRGLTPQRLYWWKKKLGVPAAGKGASSAPALVPVRVTNSPPDARRGEPVTVLLRSGHMVKVGRDFDESAFARVVALLERS
jgi:transposase